MNSDLHQDDGSMPESVENAGVYLFLRRTREDLLRHLDQTLPVDAAIAATLGPAPDLSAPVLPSEMPPSTTAWRWLLSMWIALAKLFRASRRVTTLISSMSLDDSGTSGSPHVRIDADIASLIKFAETANKARRTQRHGVEAVRILQELQRGLQERALSKEAAQSLMAQAKRHFDRLDRPLFPWRVTAAVCGAAGLISILMFDVSLLYSTFTATAVAIQVGWLVIRGTGDGSSTFRGRVRKTFGRLGRNVERLFDDSDDHSGSTLRH